MVQCGVLPSVGGVIVAAGVKMNQLLRFQI